MKREEWREADKGAWDGVTGGDGPSNEGIEDDN